MQDEIVKKLTDELKRGIASEVQVVYLLVQIRKLMEHNRNKQWDELKMFCDWGLHIEISRHKKIADFLQEVDGSLERVAKGIGPVKNDFLSLKHFRSSLENFFNDFQLPIDILNDEMWNRFIKMYAKVVSDCPITKANFPFKFIEEIRITHLHPDDAGPEYWSSRQGMYLQWQVTKKDGTVVRWEVIG